MNKKYVVRWLESHSVIVEAKDEIEAMEKASDGDIIGEESAELDGGLEAGELEYPNQKKSKIKI